MAQASTLKTKIKQDKHIGCVHWLDLYIDKNKGSMDYEAFAVKKDQEYKCGKCDRSFNGGVYLNSHIKYNTSYYRGTLKYPRLDEDLAIEVQTK